MTWFRRYRNDNGRSHVPKGETSQTSAETGGICGYIPDIVCLVYGCALTHTRKQVGQFGLVIFRMFSIMVRTIMLSWRLKHKWLSCRLFTTCLPPATICGMRACFFCDNFFMIPVHFTRYFFCFQ